MSDFNSTKTMEKNLKLLQQARYIHDTIIRLIEDDKLQSSKNIEDVGIYKSKINLNQEYIEFLVNLTPKNENRYFTIVRYTPWTNNYIRCELSVESIYEELKQNITFFCDFKKFVENLEKSIPKEELEEQESKNTSKVDININQNEFTLKETMCYSVVAGSLFGLAFVIIVKLISFVL